MVKASASRAEDPGFESRWRRDFSGSSHTSDLKIGTPVATLPGVIGSMLGLVGPVSVYCDWVRWKVWFATSISVWQHIKLSEQIRPWDTLACCWDVKQTTNKQTCGKSGHSTSSSFHWCDKTIHRGHCYEGISLYFITVFVQKRLLHFLARSG